MLLAQVIDCPGIREIGIWHMEVIEYLNSKVFFSQ